MNRFWQLSFLTIFSFALHALENNILAPNAKLIFTPTELGSYGAFSFVGELGDKNFRGSGTYGFYLTCDQRFKVSGEFLTQKLKYDLSEGKKKKWVSQCAFGAAYQYLLPTSIFQSIDLGGSYSHAFNRDSIHGSNGGAAYLGSTLELWDCGYLSAAAYYDHVKYSQSGANGFGGSLDFIQYLPKDFSFTLGSEFRKPFYFYEGTIRWDRQFRSFGFHCGLYANYTDGKEGLSNVTAGGIELGFSFGGKNERCCKSTEEKVQNCYVRNFCDLSSWVSSPAVYEPMVLAKTSGCTAPTSSTIPDQYFGGLEQISIATAPYFQSNSPLTYSATGLPPVGVTIDPTTGVISGTVPRGGPYPITVTATSACGSTSQTFTLSV